MPYFVELTLKDNFDQTVVLVNQDYQMVEEVVIFLNHLEKKGLAYNTIESYCRNLKEYYNWLEKESFAVFNVPKRAIYSFIEFVNNEIGNKQRKSPSTINKYLATLSSYYQYWESIGGYIEENPINISTTTNNPFTTHHTKYKPATINFFRQKEIKKTNNKRLFPNQVQILYDHLAQFKDYNSSNVRNKLLFKLLYETGARISEILGLRLKNYSEPSVSDDIGVIYIRKYDQLYHRDHKLKTNERDIPVSMELIYEIDDYICFHRPQLDSIDTIFVNHRMNPGKYMTRNNVEPIFQKLSTLTKVKCTPHMLRHTHGTELKESGYSSVYIMHRLGHNSFESTNQYMHISYEAQLKAYEEFLNNRREK